MKHKIVEERRGKRYVLVPEKTYDRMIEELDDLEDLRAYDRAKADSQQAVPMEIADRLIAGESLLRVWREHRKLTQQQLAQRAGITKPYLSQLESAQREASIGVIKKLAQALNVEVDDLL